MRILPRAPRTVTAVRLTDDVRKRLKKMARQKDISVSALVVFYVERGLNLGLTPPKKK